MRKSTTILYIYNIFAKIFTPNPIMVIPSILRKSRFRQSQLTHHHLRNILHWNDIFFVEGFFAEWAGGN